MAKQDKYTKSARGKPCQIRIPGYCKPAADNETTVPCHLNGAGLGIKHSSIHLAYGCNACHDVIDHRVRTNWTDEQIAVWFYDGVIRTQIIMIEEGILKL